MSQISIKNNSSAELLDALVKRYVADLESSAPQYPLQELIDSNIDQVAAREDISSTNKEIADAYNQYLMNNDFAGAAAYYEANKTVLEPLLINASLMNEIIDTIQALRAFVMTKWLDYIDELNMDYLGEWNAATDYTTGNYVRKDDSLWYAVNDNTNSSPSADNADWLLLIDFGQICLDYINSLTADVTKQLSDMNAALANKSDKDHTHDEIYAPIAHSNDGDIHVTTADKTNWNSKAAGSHTHTPASIGAAESTHTHSPASIGAAKRSHRHDATDVGTKEGDTYTYNFKDGVLIIRSAALFNPGIILTAPYVEIGSELISGSIYPETLSSGTRQLGSSGRKWAEIWCDQSSLNTSSDIRLKDNIQLVDTKACAEFIDNTEIVTFIKKEDETKTPQIGVKAQQLFEANPDIAEYVSGVDDEGYYYIKPTDLIFPLIAKVQELTKEVQLLKEKGGSE